MAIHGHLLDADGGMLVDVQNLSAPIFGTGVFCIVELVLVQLLLVSLIDQQLKLVPKVVTKSRELAQVRCKDRNVPGLVVSIPYEILCKRFDHLDLK